MEIAVGFCIQGKNFILFFMIKNVIFSLFRKYYRGRQMKFRGSLKYEEIPFTPRSFKAKNYCS